MKIKHLTISGLFGKSETVRYDFNEDLNILTGRNGSGKTTVMKLAWLIMSGNILLALKEVSFAACALCTDEYVCSVTRTGDMTCKIEMHYGGSSYLYEDDKEHFDDDSFAFLQAAEDYANPILMGKGSSLFFPTFRRIEGGFSMNSRSVNVRPRSIQKSDSEVDEALAGLSRKLTNEKHVFVSAISSKDIVSLLLKKYAEFSEEINAFQGKVTKGVIQRIKQYQNTQSAHSDADTLLSETRAEIEKIEEFSAKTLMPIDAVRELVEKLFRHSGISFGPRLSFGRAAEAINSDALSAGEKQMLSFICYNAFHKDSVVFIDEPELSLHVDWQRQLYPILAAQKSGNQFVFSTHSPFIYAKYPDKEVHIGEDRGE